MPRPVARSKGCSNRMLKKSASSVLASLRGSTYRSVRLASSLAAALPDSLFEHPQGILALAVSFQIRHRSGRTLFAHAVR